jgi:hypothetical protein
MCPGAKARLRHPLARSGASQPRAEEQHISRYGQCTLGAMGLREEYGLPPDPVIEYYKQGVDRTLLREHLKLTPQQRLEKLVAFMRSLDTLRRAARRRA